LVEKIWDQQTRIETAYNDWRYRGQPILQAAAMWQVDPEEILGCFKRDKPWSYRWFRFKLRFAIATALMFGVFINLGRDIRRITNDSLGGDE
jgi:hypothetical protein